MSEVGPHEGTLRVLPIDLKLATAYIILRPFFSPVRGPQHLDFNDWKLDLDSTHFPGSSQGRSGCDYIELTDANKIFIAQELNIHTHPHLQLDRTMVSAPRLSPGDQVYCKQLSYLFETLTYFKRAQRRCTCCRIRASR